MDVVWVDAESLCERECYLSSAVIDVQSWETEIWSLWGSGVILTQKRMRTGNEPVLMVAFGVFFHVLMAFPASEEDEENVWMLADYVLCH